MAAPIIIGAAKAAAAAHKVWKVRKATQAARAVVSAGKAGRAKGYDPRNSAEAMKKGGEFIGRMRPKTPSGGGMVRSQAAKKSANAFNNANFSNKEIAAAYALTYATAFATRKPKKKKK